MRKSWPNGTQGLRASICSAPAERSGDGAFWREYDCEVRVALFSAPRELKAVSPLRSATALHICGGTRE
jgi:hypothetical protein